MKVNRILTPVGVVFLGLAVLTAAHAQFGGPPPGAGGGGSSPGTTDVGPLHLDFKDVATTGVSTAGLVIATSIFLQMLITKFTSTFERFRTLTGEYRHGTDGGRKDSVERQITQYYRRCHLIRVTSSLLLWTDLVFLVTIFSTSMTVVLPKAIWIKFLAGGSIVIGVIMLAIAFVMALVENGTIRSSLDSELDDFPNLPLK